MKTDITKRPPKGTEFYAAGRFCKFTEQGGVLYWDKVEMNWKSMAVPLSVLEGLSDYNNLGETKK